MPAPAWPGTDESKSVLSALAKQLKLSRAGQCMKLDHRATLRKLFGPRSSLAVSLVFRVTEG